MFNGQRRKSGYSGVCVHLGRLTIGASRNELPEEGGHSWPPIVLLHSVKSSEEPFMPSGRGVVKCFDEVMMCGFRDVQAMFKV